MTRKIINFFTARFTWENSVTCTNNTTAGNRHEIHTRCIAQTCVIAALFMCTASAFTLPGFTPYVADTSGEYVYYEDKTFKRKSYVGFLCYDEKTYAARYYAPAQKNLEPLAVTLFFTVDPNADHMEITGERLVTERTMYDGEIINYLHDMIYELNARRIKAGHIVLQNERIVPDNFMQFGGSVVIEYDYYVPLFNVKKIAKGDNMDIVFEAVTAGKIASSADTSFARFTGLPDSYTAKKTASTLKKNVEKKTFTSSDGQSVELDAQWNHAMENMWMLGNDAAVSMAALPPNKTSSQSADASAIRRLILSNGTSYADWRTISISKQNGKYVTRCTFYDSEKKSVTHVYRKLTKKSDDGFFFFALTVFKGAYDANKTYFEKIINSYMAMPNK